MRYRILPYKQASASAKALATALGGKVLRLSGSTFKPKSDDVIIGWGNTSHPGYTTMLNFPEHILEASNKLRFFNLCKEACPDVIPRFWTVQSEIPSNSYPVVCRTVLAGHSGAGIRIAGTPEELVEAPLYVQYIKKKDEYRVHCGKRPHVQTSLDVFGDPDIGDGFDYRVILVQRKARRQDCENPDWQVRNHANGFVYVRNDVNPPASVVEAALQSFRATSLDFGAVDVIYNAHQEKAYVLEINTAPGLEGSTVTDYADFFQVSA